MTETYVPYPVALGPPSGDSHEETTARLAAIIESSEDAIISKSLQGIITTWNASAERLFGYAAEEAIGQPITLIIPPERQEEEQTILQRLRQGERLKHIETVRRAKSGRLLDVSLTISPIRNAAGQIIGASKIARDISERKRAEAALHRHNQGLQLLSQAAAELLAPTDPTQIVESLFATVGAYLEADVFLNYQLDDTASADTPVLRLETASGLDEATHAALAQRELGQGLCGTAALERHAVYLPAVHRSVDPQAAEVRGLGVRVYVCQPLWAGERLMGTLSFASRTKDRFEPEELEFIRIISHYVATAKERLRTETRLRQSEAQFRQLADSMPQLVWTADPAGVVDYYNRRRQEYGEPLAAGEPGDWQSLLHPDDVERTVTAWQQASAAGVPYEMEHRLRRADGHYYWHLSRAMPVRDALGRIIKWYGTATNIDALKRAEAALQAADRRKDEFLAILAHELRNPLASIRHAAQVLHLIGSKQPKSQQACAIIDRQVSHLVRLVDDLLDVSRIARGQILLRPERLDMVQLVRQTAEDYRSLLDTGGIQLVLEMPDKPLWVEGDPVRLAQLSGNLLHNAHKFTPRGGTVTVHLKAEGQSAVVRVQDTGIGIEPALLERLFEPFSQAAQGLARSRGGLGLGLALVRGLVELHGGEVRAASRGPGQGAEFTIRLPLQPAPTLPAQREIPAAVARESYRVLIIEDNRDAAESLAMLLELLGYKVCTAYSGVEGLEAARAFSPQVVLCDIGLPDLDGYQVARSLRMAPALGGMALVALTGYGREEDQQQAHAAGFDLHLTKPLDLPTLQQALAHLKALHSAACKSTQ